MARSHEICLTGSFLLLMAAVPLTQAGLEIYQGERPQFVDLFAIFRQWAPPTEKHLRDFEKTLEESSWAARTVRPQMQRLRFVLLHDPGPKALYGRDDWLFYKPGVDYLTQTSADEPQPNSGPQAALAAIVDFRDQLAERGIRLLVVPVPGKASVYPDKLTSRSVDGSTRFQSRTKVMLEKLQQHGVETVDLFDVFRQLRDADRTLSDTLYLQRDTHWSGSGVRAAAAAIAGRIKALGWLEAGTTQYDLKPVTVHRQGDILNMVDVPQLKQPYPAEEVLCAQVMQSSKGALYVDNPASPILLLGDSFARIYQRDEPGSAGLIAHLARELAMPLSSVVNDGGASTLLRQELSRRPKLLEGKKLVIWEFVERDIRYGTEGWQRVALPAAGPHEHVAGE